MLQRKETKMQRNPKILIGLILSLMFALEIIGSGASQNGKGKFYIVGMGTAADLITMRGVEVIKSSNIVLVASEQEREIWKDHVTGKEVWYCPDSLRIMYGRDPRTIQDPQIRAVAENATKTRRELADRIRAAVEQGKVVAFLQGGDPMMFGQTFLLELLPKDLPSEIVPGIGALQAASAAVKMSPPYGYDTSGVILTMADWSGRVDTNEKLMASGSSMVFYTMLFDYPLVFSQLQRHYPADTPVAVVIDAGDRVTQKVVRSTVGRFLKEVDFKNFPAERHLLLVGKFLNVGQARKNGVSQIEKQHVK
jgi:precorrin-4/cobalt-precorrin-4 C11-methyltransferase